MKILLIISVLFMGCSNSTESETNGVCVNIVYGYNSTDVSYWACWDNCDKNGCDINGLEWIEGHNDCSSFCNTVDEECPITTNDCLTNYY